MNFYFMCTAREGRQKMDENRVYIAIDLKSFYASVECQARGLNPLTTNLVVADESRTEKTICLAVSPSLKSYGIPGRARLFEVAEKVREVNAKRLKEAPGHRFTGKSYINTEVQADPSIELSYIAAMPRMAKYIECSTQVYSIYLRYVAPEDIHVYSIDEVFMDVTAYLKTYGLSARELAMKIIKEVLLETGVTATAGIGTNLYLCKIAMDVVAKHIPADENGVRIAELDERTYREQLWEHRPLTDFWRVGRGTSKKLEEVGLFTMGDIARCSIGGKNEFYNEELLFKLFGINAELLIDHAWGWEPTKIADIKAYKPEANSLSTGQVLQSPYTFEKARLIVAEMTDILVLDIVDKCLVTDQIVLTVGYDVESLSDPEVAKRYHGEITTDFYGRTVPKHAHGTINLGKKTSSGKLIIEKALQLYDRIVNPDLLVRRIYVVAGRVYSETETEETGMFEQLDLFTDYDEREKQREKEKRERSMQHAVLDIKKKYGKNAILKGMNLQEGGTAIERNAQIGGHKK